MPKKFAATIDKKDLKQLLKKFEGLEELDNYVDKQMSVAVKEAENKASVSFRSTFKQRTGQGRSSIKSGKNKKNEHYVKTDKEYMPFLEFGTVEHVDVSKLADLGIDAEFAMQYKGKGIRKSGGIKAGHYFFPNIKIAYDAMIERIKKDLNKILNK